MGEVDEHCFPPRPNPQSMNIHLIVVGKLKESYWSEAEAEYLKRLQPFFNVTIHELKEESFTEKDPAEVIKEKEAVKIVTTLEKLDVSYVVALEEKGKLFSSPDFAKQFRTWQETYQNIAFIIGGPVGIHETIRTKANTTFSLSPLTFTHQMARVLLVEQLYRAAMITAGRRYHY